MKTSNVSLDDILTRQRDAADNSIALFQDGKLKPGAFVNTITDKLTEYDTEFNDHIKVYNNFRRNVVGKFFGNPISVLPSLADIKTFIEQQEIAADIVKNDISKMFPRLERQEAAADTIKSDISKMTPKLDKIKIPHERFSNIVYTKKSGTFDWTVTNNMMHINVIVKGIYRLTLVSEAQFKISSLAFSSSTNNVLSVVIDKDETRLITITSIDSSLPSATIAWCMEFVAEL